MKLRTPASAATIAVLALGAAACGSSSDSSSSASSASTPASSSSSTSSSAKPLANIPSLTGKSTAVKLDAKFVKALGQLKLTPSPTGKASISKAGVASFPITGGNVKYYNPGTVSPYVQGKIMHNGSGLQLKGGGKTVRLTNFVVDPGKSVLTGKVTVDGKTAAPSAELFFLNGNTLKPLKVNKGNGTAVLKGTTVEFKDSAATLLNKTFGVKALKGGLVVGVATITVNVG
jgi:hypothetical protein